MFMFDIGNFGMEFMNSAIKFKEWFLFYTNVNLFIKCNVYLDTFRGDRISSMRAVDDIYFG